jgi:hypothetical protein
MKKVKKQSREVIKEDYPKTFQLLKDLEDLLKDPDSEYPQW